MSAEDVLARGRELFAQQRWDGARTLLTEADRATPLGAEDLVRIATSAQMLGDADSAGAWARAHTELVRCGDTENAARCAYWLIVPMLFRNETAQAGGWIARTQRLLEGVNPGSGAHGHMLCVLAVRALMQKDFASAHVSFVEAVRIAERVGDADLAAQARHGEGRTLIRLGERERGTLLLDEVMAAVTAGAVSPPYVGVLYCSVLEACHEMNDVRRAQEWTDAMAAWCSRQPEALSFRGQCLIHRAELMQLHGAWSKASEEAASARERFMRPPPTSAIGQADYRIADLQRLRGELAEAEEGYRRASQSGVDPQPGLALLRLAQRQTGAARTAIAMAMEETHDEFRRARLIPAYVEIALAAGDVKGARAMADELMGVAATGGAPMLHASAEHAIGAVRLAEGDARSALGALRDAYAIWRELEAPYEAARARVLIARALHLLGDADGAAMELACAREAFAELGAAHDLAALEQRAGASRGDERVDAPLTPREVEVLRLVATGKTNRMIAESLGISEKTIARHMSNIFTKLGLSSRAAATAYAYERRILQGST